MENKQKKTDFQILLDYLIERGIWNSTFSPFEMIKAAISFLDQIKACNAPIPINLFLKRTYEYGEKRSKPAYFSEESHYSFIIAIYILVKAEGPQNIHQQNFIYDIEKILQLEERALFDYQAANNVVQQIQEYRLSAPKFYTPMDEIKEIANGKNLDDIDWPRLLTQMLRFAGYAQTNFPYFITLHSFLIAIPDAMIRVEVLGCLKKAAPQCMDEQQAKQLIADANMLVPTYMRLRELLKENPLPSVWANDKDLNEFVLLMNDIKPKELVALSQVIIDYRLHRTEKQGILAHILKMPLFMGKIVTTSGLEFCRGLYLAVGDKQWILSGVGENYFEMPTTDTHNVKFWNACYDIYLNYCIDILKKADSKEKQKINNLSHYYWRIYKNLEFEYNESFPNQQFREKISNAYLSLKARLEDLIAYTTQKTQELEEKEHKKVEMEKTYEAPRISCFKYIISSNIDEITKIHKRIELYLSSPAKLRDELARLQDEGLISLPMDNPTAIIRAIREVWGERAPKERSFVTTWGRRF